MIDVKDLIAKYSAKDLIKSADEYFSIHANKARLMQKPFNDLEESTETVLTFLHVVKGLGLAPGARVLDFGAGSCWTSRILAGFGYRVVACDVSDAALQIGRELLEAHPPFIDHHPIEFLPFDGVRLSLDDETIDAICCISAFHHAHNPLEVVAEFGRVLKPWGTAGLSEPGPNHSRTPASQSEMARYTVIENDVVIEDIWRAAQAAGFTDLDLCVFNPTPKFVTLDRFNAFVGGEHLPDWEQETRNLMVERRLFFLEKGEPGIGSSKAPAGLGGKLSANVDSLSGAPGQSFAVEVVATNDGTALWRPSDWFIGPVRLGPKFAAPNGSETYPPRWMMPPLPRHGVLPGEQVRFTGHVTLPSARGTYQLVLQLVSEMVAWFGETRTIEVVVR